jgi:two-component system, OmpR family, response regulator
MTRCLLVDDDDEIRTALSEYLQGFGLQVQAVADGVAMRQAFIRETFDIAVLDVMLPGEDGLSLCRWIRAQRPDTAVIMLTAQGDPASRVVGLEFGADDYLGKPFEPRELVARIHAVLRRGSAAEGVAAGAARRSTVHFAGWAFDRLQRQLHSPDAVLMALSSAEFRLLSAFIDHPRRPLARERLVELTCTPGTAINDRSIDLAVSRLRTKLGDSPKAHSLIRTVRGQGYMFDAEVTR